MHESAEADWQILFQTDVAAPERDQTTLSLLSAARAAVAAEHSKLLADAEQIHAKSSAAARRAKKALEDAQQGAAQEPGNERLLKAVADAQAAYG